MNLKDADPTASTSTGASAESYFQAQIKILQSRTLIERVVAKLHLDSAGSQTKRKFRWISTFSLRADPPGADRQRLIESLSDHLSVRTPAQTHMVEVVFDSEDPQFSANFVNALVQEFVTYSREMRWTSTQTTANWLKDHIDGMKTKLEASETRLQVYAKSAGLLFTTESEHLAELKLRQFQDELARSQAERAEKQSRYELAKSHASESLPSDLGDGTLKDYHLKLADLERELAELSSTLTPEHYRVRKVEAQIAQLKASVNEEQHNVVTRSANEYERARRSEALLKQAYGDQAKVVSDQAQKAIHFNTLKNEVETNRQIYSALLQRVQQAGFASAMRAGNILVVDTADRPFFPYSPNFLLNAAIGLFCGTFVAVGFILIRERLDASFRDPGLAPIYLNLPELGVIPKFKEGVRRRGVISPYHHSGPWLPFRLASARLSKNVTNGASKSVKRLSRGRIVWEQNPPFVDDAFRAVLSSLLLPGLHDETPHVIVVGSPGPGAGKTTVTQHLGIAAAEIGRRVLLIDGDLRRPRLHEVFNFSSHWGLSDLIRSSVPVETALLSQLSLQTELPGLFVLPSGSPVENPTQLLYSSRMADLLSRMRREFDLVLVDAPPLVQLADARILGRLADGVILVLLAGHTSRQAASLACARLAEDSTRIVGTILNNWDFRHGLGRGYRDLQDAYESTGAHLTPNRVFANSNGDTTHG